MELRDVICVTLLFLGLFVRCSVPLTFRVAWLAPESRYGNLEAGSSVGGLGLAIDDLTTLGSHTYNVRWEDSDCKSNVSLARVYDVIVRDQWNPHVIIGPPCSTSMKFIAELAGYRNLPIVGWQSNSPTFENKAVYNTLIRVLPPINTVGPGLMETMARFKWTKAFLASTNTEPYQEVAYSIEQAFEAHKDISLTRSVTESPDPTSEDLKAVYRTLKQEARIVILVVPRSELRTWLLQAADSGMTDGDYVFIYVNSDHPTNDVINTLTSAAIWRTGVDDNKAKGAFENLLIFTPRPTEGDSTFYDKADTAGVAWGASLGIRDGQADEYAPFLHDAVQLYTQLAEEADQAGLDYTDGQVLFDLAKGRTFNGAGYVTSPIVLDENADRRPNFALYDLADKDRFTLADITETFISGGQIQMVVQEVAPVVWGDGSSGVENAPPTDPVCGYDNENCPNLTLYIAPACVFVVLIIIAVAAYLIHRRIQFEKSIKDMAWKLDRNELKTNKKKDHLSVMLAGSKASSILHSRASSYAHGMMSQLSMGKHSASASMVSSTAEDKSQIFVNVAQYRGATVAVKHVRKPKLKLDRAQLVEMRNMTNIKHNNLAMMIGATTDPPEIMEVWEYCSKGSLQDVIWNDNIGLDDMFKFSISIDIFKGLKYLHDGPLKIHGKLKSSNCVIDGRWTCKLTDYGLFQFRDGATEDPEMSDFSRYSRMFWTAPEVLRKQHDGASSFRSQEADIYAGGIILKEIFARNGPYTELEDDMEPDEIIDKVKGIPRGTPFRPDLSETKGKCPDKLMDVMTHCWSEKPQDRPSPSHVIKDIQKINPNKSTNVMDNMVRMMERYTNHLEDVVGERTQQVEEEKKKSEMLLFRMLPKPIAEDLKRGKTVEAESFDSVSLYFSDIVSFTSLSAQSTPMQVVDLLNRLYTIFDSAIASHDVYKVETIGDAYMLASGLPRRNGDNHAVDIANAAMDLLSGIMGFKVAHMPDDYVLRIRIGLHTGPTVAGVVGITMPRYCLFGNTVTIAQTMESGGMPMRIHLSEMTYKILKKFSGYTIASRNDPLDVKGLGKVNTYWLVAREGYTKTLPDFKELSAEDSPQPTVMPVTKGRTFRSSVTDSMGFEPETESAPSRKTSELEPKMQQIPERVTDDGKSHQAKNDGSTSDEFKEVVDDIQATEVADNAQDEAEKSSEPDSNAEPVDDKSSIEDDTSSKPDSLQGNDNEAFEEEPEVSWADPGKAAALKKATTEVARPTTATSIRARLNLSKPNTLPDLVLEDTMLVHEDTTLSQDGDI